MKTKLTRIYFLCYQIRFRSQMAEAFASFYSGELKVIGLLKWMKIPVA
ncbi:hypothetical protein [Paenibacillus agricola]|uniref:Uncharacterized protein n=1 Tax=Paenibacillus agricola TaxID=2716264 RepID=A0ABX0JC18_9BACL|nr:hypothetical protein [Paenibacillus agricola]NHN34057.1 hypothetical protein [Paenibacillus agricola]